MARSALQVALVGLALTITGCAWLQPEQPAEEAPVAQRPLNDAEIAGVVETIDSAVLSQAQLALDRSEDARLRAFAQNLVDDHRNIDRRVLIFAEDAGAAAEESPFSRQLHQWTKAYYLRLAEMDDAAFRETFFETQIRMHREALAIFDETLIPDARAEQFRQRLRKAASILREHLRSAQQLAGT